MASEACPAPQARQNGTAWRGRGATAWRIAATEDDAVAGGVAGRAGSARLPQAPQNRSPSVSGSPQAEHVAWLAGSIVVGAVELTSSLLGALAVRMGGCYR